MDKLDELKQQREDNFKKIGQLQLQKMYYEQDINRLLKQQEELCSKIYNLSKKCD